MPAERDHQSASGTSHPSAPWPGQDIPRQHGGPHATAASPWPAETALTRPEAPASQSSPWPETAEQAPPIASDEPVGQGWAPPHHQPADETEWAPQQPAVDRQWPAYDEADAGHPVPPSSRDTGYPPIGPGAGPGRRFAEPPLPASHADGRRLRRLALVAVVALALIGGGIAVATLREPDTTPPQAVETPENGLTTAPSPGAVTPSATPSDTSGLGGRPASPSPSGTAPGGREPSFTGTRQTLPGASVAVQRGETFSQALSRSDRTFGTLKMARVFFPGLPPAWDNSRAGVADRTVVVSFKAPPKEVNAGRHDSRLASWFRSIPRDHNVYWSYFHEPEDDVERGAFTAADYRSAWRRIAELANRADNPKLINTVILMCWTLDPNSKRDFAAFYPGGDLVETLGWDCYNWGAKWKRYASPQEIYGRMISKSRELGKPWGVAETGSDLVPGDSGTGRAAWIRSMSGYLNGERPEFVAYYNQVVSQGDFRLQDSPSIQAWRSFCAA
ncbi:hypothetical protein ACH4OY_05615 [Micromonospora rubida]|uniref:GH26 domain-containing protein n=1 Tax=Micromonospora rubida TaxID=2697657 RepID=A0ABW7SER8_9ACTN